MCLALFASSALAAPAPQTTRTRTQGPQDTSALVNTILGQLDGSIDAAIQAALGGPRIQEKITITPSAFGGKPIREEKFIVEQTDPQSHITERVKITPSAFGGAPLVEKKFISPGKSSPNTRGSSSSTGQWSAWTTVGSSGQTKPR